MNSNHDPLPCLGLSAISQCPQTPVILECEYRFVTTFRVPAPLKNFLETKGWHLAQRKTFSGISRTATKKRRCCGIEAAPASLDPRSIKLAQSSSMQNAPPSLGHSRQSTNLSSLLLNKSLFSAFGFVWRHFGSSQLRSCPWPLVGRG